MDSSSSTRYERALVGILFFTWGTVFLDRMTPLYLARLSRALKFGEHKELLLAFDAFDVFNRQNINEVTSVYGGGTADFCGGTTPFNGPVPQRYGDAASLAIQQGKVACLPYSGAYASFAVAPAPDALFGTPRTMFNPRQLQASLKFTF